MTSRSMTSRSMTSRYKDLKNRYQPNPEVLKLWPDISGNEINGLGEQKKIRPRPVFWRTDESTPQAPVMYYFYRRDEDNANIAGARKYRESTATIPNHDIAEKKVERPPQEWTELLKRAALEMDADDIGICAWREEWAFPDRPKPRGKLF